MVQKQSLAFRAVLAVLLMIGFYVLAMSIAAVLLYIPYAEWVYADRIHIKLAIGCVVAALAILWSILPRIDRFEAPGPKLSPVSQKRLFTELRAIAAAVGQPMPSEVYLVPEVNAWVTQRGGVMGFGSRRVMGLGLPLMQALTTTQFRAVLGHEFGHYYSGDTRLGPWIYKTRAAIGRTLESLGEEGILHKPFVWYGNFFLRVTQAISRRQELVADEMAARAVGARALSDGLVATHKAAVAYDSYWSSEVVPVLQAGFRAPIAEGFAHFVKAEGIASALGTVIEEELKTGQGDIYDSHPPLRERIEALSHLPQEPVVADDPPAASLLTNVAQLEAEMLSAMAGEQAAGLKPVQWNETAETVFLPAWKARVADEHDGLAGMTPAAFAAAAADLSSFSAKLSLREVPAEYRQDAASSVLGCALAVTLHEQGWRCDATPGQQVVFAKEGMTLAPFTLVSDLAGQKTSATEFQALCDGAGVAALLLPQPQRLQ